MLQTFYDNFGFFGALTLSLFLFFFFIFWLAGMAGITLPYDGGKKRGNPWQIIIAVFVPIYPVAWLVYDMYKQKRFMGKN